MKKVKLLDNILDHTDDGVLVIGMDGIVLSANAMAVSMLSLADQQPIGSLYHDIFSNPDYYGELLHIIYEGLSKGIEHHLHEINISQKGHEPKKILASTSLLTDKDSIGKLAKQQSLVVFLKSAAENVAGLAGQVSPEDYRRLKADYETIKNRYDDLQKLLSKFDLFKITVAGFVFIIFLVVIFYSRESIKIFPADAVPAERRKVQEHLATARLDTLEMNINLSGIIEPYNKVTIAARTSGKVVKRNFKDGDYVPKGHILYQMDTKELAKNVRSARVSYMELLEQYDQLKDWENSLEVMQAKRSYELSKISLDNEKKKLNETKKLFEKGIIPRVEYDQANTSFKKAQYDFENAKQTLESKLDKGSPEKLEMLKLKLSNAKDALDEIEDRYEATLIRAPVSGIVMQPVSSDGKHGNYKNAGDMVNDGDIVATIGATEAFLINSAVGELSVNNIHDGQIVTITGASFPDVALQGRIDWVAANATIEGDTRYYPIRISITGVPDSIRQQIRMGMYADAVIHIRKLEGVVTVPIEALSEENGHDVVYVDNGTGSYESRIVQSGYSNLDKIVIASGLQAGESVLLRSAEGS